MIEKLNVVKAAHNGEAVILLTKASLQSFWKAFSKLW